MNPVEINEINRVKQPDILAVMTDYLALGGLGAYGHTAAETPAFDRLSMESVLFDQYYAADPDQKAAYRDYWFGHEAGKSPEPVSLAEAASRAGYETVLVTDAPETAQYPGNTFDRTILLLYQAAEPASAEPASAKSVLAGEVEETALYRFFVQTAQAYLEAKNSGKPVFLWAHTAGFGGKWDFPASLRELFVEDEEDPAPYGGSAPPYAELLTAASQRQTAGGAAAALPDYDRLCAAAETYAAGMSVWDRGLEAFLEPLRLGNCFQNAALILGSVRGFPLGEHSRIGIAPDRSFVFYAEELHLPLLIRFPGTPDGAYRVSAVCEPADLSRTIAGLVRPAEEDNALADLASGRRAELKSSIRLSARSGEDCWDGLITPEWFLRRKTEAGGAESVELYVRPDDRNDVNDVASRCPDACAELLARMKTQPGIE